MYARTTYTIPNVSVYIYMKFMEVIWEVGITSDRYFLIPRYISQYATISSLIKGKLSVLHVTEQTFFRPDVCVVVTHIFLVSPNKHNVEGSCVYLKLCW